MTSRTHLSLECLESRVVLSANPVLTPTQNLFMAEGFQQTLPFLARFTDVMDTDTQLFTASIDWGDSTAITNIDATGIGDGRLVYTSPTSDVGALISGQVTAQHIYAASGTYNVTLTLFDGLGGSDMEEFGIEVFPFATPEQLSVSGNSATNEGSPYTLSILSDFGVNNVTSYRVSWGDEIQTGVSSNSVNHTYADDEMLSSWIGNQVFGGTKYQVFVAATLSNGETYFGNGGVLLTVNDVAPIFTIGGASSVAAGDVYTLNLATIDPGVDQTQAWVIDWDFVGDVNNPAATFNYGGAEIIFGDPSTATHVYTDDGAVHTIVAFAINDDGLQAFSNAHEVTVGSVPTADAGGPYTTIAGAAITLAGVASGGTGPYSFAWDLDGDGIYGETGGAAGNGNENVAAPVFNPNGFTGTRTVRLKVTDSSNTTSEESTSTVEVLAQGALVVDGNLHVVGSSTLGDNVSVTLSGGNLSIQTGNGTPVLFPVGFGRQCADSHRRR